MSIRLQKELPTLPRLMEMGGECLVLQIQLPLSTGSSMCILGQGRSHVRNLGGHTGILGESVEEKNSEDDD